MGLESNIFTCDPNKVLGARKLDYVTYGEMLELAALGAKVLHMVKFLCFQPRHLLMSKNLNLRKEHFIYE